MMITNVFIEQALFIGISNRCPCNNNFDIANGFIPPNGSLPPLNISQQVTPNDHYINRVIIITNTVININTHHICFL